MDFPQRQSQPVEHLNRQNKIGEQQSWDGEYLMVDAIQVRDSDVVVQSVVKNFRGEVSDQEDDQKQTEDPREERPPRCLARGSGNRYGSWF